MVPRHNPESEAYLRGLFPARRYGGKPLEYEADCDSAMAYRLNFLDLGISTITKIQGCEILTCCIRIPRAKSGLFLRYQGRWAVVVTWGLGMMVLMPWCVALLPDLAAPFKSIVSTQAGELKSVGAGRLGAGMLPLTHLDIGRLPSSPKLG